MKKIVFTILLVLLGTMVKAEKISLEDLNKTINYGKFTKEYIQKINKDYEYATIDSSIVSENELTIVYYYHNEKESFNELLTFKYDEEKNILVGEFTILKGDKDDHKYQKELFRMIPLWVIETSKDYKKVISYIEEGENKIDKIDALYDKCYMQEMAVCLTNLDTRGDVTYTVKVELNERPANYVISKFKEEAQKKEQKKILRYVAYAGVVLLILYVIASSGTKAKPIKY